jgi:hypothetical protein
MDTSITKNDYLIAIIGGLLIALSTSLNYLIWGRKEIITEHFFKLWTQDGKIFKCLKQKGIELV